MIREPRLNIAVTMAGAGARFRRAGFVMPKPLIPAFGEAMYRHAIRSLPLDLAEKLVVVILDDEHAAELERDIVSQFAPFSPMVVKIAEITGGQAETMLAAAPSLSRDLPLLIHNADSAIVCPAFYDLDTRIDGGICVFESRESRWSYARTDADGRVVEVREKQVISDKASTGTYYFRSSATAFELAAAAIERNERECGEFYIAPLFNKMIDQRQEIATIPVEAFVCFGTPDDLTAAEAHAGARATVDLVNSTYRRAALARNRP